jgi:Pyruvate phosphate dikinase, AMP/ATP-binding domain
MSSRVAYAAVVLALCGCTFEDHTLGRLDAAEDFFASAPRQGRRASVKFVITDYDDPSARALRYYDSNFYKLHDEWSWFRLLNGQTVPGIQYAPVSGLSFSSIDSIYEWAKVQTRLPMDLRWVDGDRLYSPLFYDLGVFRRPLKFGLGTLMHVDATDAQPERWVFFLEYVYQPTPEDLAVYFQQLEATLPPDLYAQVQWAVRSPAHETVAQEMEARGLPFSDRIIRFKELASAGETEVYNDGLTAGRLFKLEKMEDLGQVVPTDVLMIDQVPDELPPSAGLLTAEPQTPLAHVNLLAKNRRIPNAYQGGLFDDVQLNLLAAYRTPVLVLAESPSTLTVKAITEAEYQTFVGLQTVTPASVPQVDIAALPYTVDLTAHTLAEADALRPAIGGKAAGFLALHAGAPHAVPPHATAVTIRGYAEHVAPLRPLIDEALAHPEFQGSPRVRALALEGTIMYPLRFASSADVAFELDFLAAHPEDALGQLARSGGIVGRIRAQPIEAATLEAITDALRAQFGGYDKRQALRFRSSSTAEDIEGFNGAGLYESSSGFLDAAAQEKQKDKEKTIEAALKATWSSYWRLTAFEERRLEGVDHLSGSMAMVVHARHDDALELANGVVLFTVQPPGSPDEAVLELNVQLGPESVTNPGTGSSALPEVDRVIRSRAGVLRLERVRGSTLLVPEARVFSDEKLEAVYADVKAVADAWQAEANATLPPARRGTALVLDFELREVGDDWPMGTGLPRRILLRQVRSIEPGSRRVPQAVRQLPIPVDLLGRARRVALEGCENDEVRFEMTTVLTDPLLAPDVGYSVNPFTASASVLFKTAAPALGRAAGERVLLEHLDFASVTRTGQGAVTLLLNGPATASARFSELRFDGLSTVHVGDATTGIDVTGLSCQSALLFSTPQEYLRSLL